MRSSQPITNAYDSYSIILQHLDTKTLLKLAKTSRTHYEYTKKLLEEKSERAANMRQMTALECKMAPPYSEKIKNMITVSNVTKATRNFALVSALVPQMIQQYQALTELFPSKSNIAMLFLLLLLTHQIFLQYQFNKIGAKDMPKNIGAFGGFLYKTATREEKQTDKLIQLIQLKGPLNKSFK